MALAVMVLGAESSGNRLMTRLLVAAGCYGDGDVSQRLDARIPDAAEGQPIVWLRSVPHAGEYPDLGACFVQLKQRGYTVKAVVMMRDWYPMIQSQVATGHTDTIESAELRTRQAYQHIFSALVQYQMDYVTVTLGGLIRRPRAVLGWLTEWLGLPMPADHEAVMDVNQKWWAERGSA